MSKALSKGLSKRLSKALSHFTVKALPTHSSDIIAASVQWRIVQSIGTHRLLRNFKVVRVLNRRESNSPSISYRQPERKTVEKLLQFRFEIIVNLLWNVLRWSGLLLQHLLVDCTGNLPLDTLRRAPLRLFVRKINLPRFVRLWVMLCVGAILIKRF